MPVVVPGQQQTSRLPLHRKNAFLVRSDSAELAFGTVEPGHDVLWLWHDVVGWFSTPPLETATSAMGTSGLHVAPPRFPESPRQITVVGTCVATTMNEAFAARQRLFDAWGDPDFEHGLIVEEPTGPKKLNVRLAGEITAPWARPVQTFAFEIPLIAADPIKYALTPTVASTPPVVGGAYTVTFPVRGWPVTWQGTGQQAGIMQVTNAGNRSAWPMLRIRGPAEPGWRVTNLTTGALLGLDVALRADQVIDVDMRRARVSMGGSRVAAAVAGEWWELEPGTNRIQFTVPSYQAGDASLCTCSLHSSWR